MSEVKSTTIVPIAFYCFILSFIPISFSLNSIFSNTSILSSDDFGNWLPVIASVILSTGIFLVGMGILNLNMMCWKVLFFTLAICVSSIATFLLVYLSLLLFGINILYTYLRIVQVADVTWLSFLSFFISVIIVLYYLTRHEVVSSFGDLGERINPFGLY